MRITRSTGAFSGVILVILGIWGALIPFVGPYFNYSFGINSTWHYTTDRLWLDILPGAVALIAGLLLLRARTRTMAVLGGCLGVIAGVWLVIGPAVSLTWERAPGPIGAPLYSTTRQMLELLGYFYLLGALILVFGVFVLGRVIPARTPAGPSAPVEGDPGSIASAPREPAATRQSSTRQPARSRVRVPFRRRERTRT